MIVVGGVITVVRGIILSVGGNIQFSPLLI